MFKFLFGRKGDDVKPETQRDTAVRVLEELNEILQKLDPKPAVKIDMASGQLEITWPDQMPDEALALPAPEDKAKEDAKSTDKIAEDLAKAAKDAPGTKATKTAN